MAWQIFVIIHESTYLLQRNVDRWRFAVNKDGNMRGRIFPGG